MIRIYTTQKIYLLKEIGNLIKDKSQEEKSLIKAQELGKVKLPKKFIHISQDGTSYDIEIIKQPTEERGLLKVSVRAFKNGKELFVDNPLYFKNPPIMMHDGTYYKETNFLGEEIVSRNLVEHPIEVLKNIIVDTVRITGK